MNITDKLFKEACLRCESWPKDTICEDKLSCPVYKLYCLANEKSKVRYKTDVWNIPPQPKAEMI